MIFSVGFLRRFLFGLSLTGMDTFWKEFPGSETDARKRLRLSSNSFISGYNTALEAGLTRTLFSELQAFDPAFRGFAYEGAGMGMAMIDYTTPGQRNRLREFVEMAPEYTTLAYIGAGFAIAVLNRDLQSTLAPMDPMQRWWAMDGYGFYCGIFRMKKSLEQQFVPAKVVGYGRRAFDRGIGRSIWFLFSGDVEGIVQRIQAFPQERQADIWSGIGVASTYAGGVDRATLEAVRAAAGPYASYASVGSASAATARYHANNIVEHNDLACSVHCGMSAENAAKLAIALEQELIIDAQEPVFVTEPIYEIYREKLRAQFMPTPVAV